MERPGAPAGLDGVGGAPLRGLARPAALLLALGLGCRAPLTGPASPPNIVLFVVDDLGWRDAGFQGSRFYLTPRMDALAAEGVVFTDAYSNGPNCAPSRASLMTGAWTPRHGIYTVGSARRGRAEDRRLEPPRNRRDLDASLGTIAEVLRDRGYATGIFGKWHLGDDPTVHGFDVNVGGHARGSPPGGHFSPYDNPRLSDGPAGESLAARLTDEAISFVRERAGEPFFVYLPHYAVHTPIQARPEEAAVFAQREPDGGQANADYAAMVAEVDRSLGRLLDVLDELDLAANTLVVFTSDNGGHGPVTSQAPLRGAKGMLYEGGIRVPLVLRWPGHARPGARCPEPVSGVDLFSTLAAAAGALDLDRDGTSLLPLLAGDAPLGRDALYWHFPAYLERTRGVEGPWRTTPAGAIRRGRHKLLEFFGPRGTSRLELYDLALDPGEQHDLARERPALTASLHGRLVAWREATGAAMPTDRAQAADRGR